MCPLYVSPKWCYYYSYCTTVTGFVTTVFKETGPEVQEIPPPPPWGNEVTKIVSFCNSTSYFVGSGLYVLYRLTIKV